MKAAKTAKAVIDQLSTTTAPKLTLWRTLRTAKDAAVLNLGSDGGRALNDARDKTGIALSNVMDGPLKDRREYDDQFNIRKASADEFVAWERLADCPAW